jgi:hypothetical protein
MFLLVKKKYLFMCALLISPTLNSITLIISYKQLRKVKLGVLEIFSSLFIINKNKTKTTVAFHKLLPLVPLAPNQPFFLLLPLLVSDYFVVNKNTAPFALCDKAREATGEATGETTGEANVFVVVCCCF